MRNRLRDAMVVATTTAVLAVFAVAVRPTTAQGGYQAPRLSGTKNPNLSGIWQVLNTANWDIQAHSARAALAVVRGPAGEVPAAAALALGAVGGVPGGLGVVEGNEIPYRPEALAKKKENAANVLTRSPVCKTSVCDSGPLARPAARFVMQDKAATRNPHCRATMASGTVLIPTASAPRRPNAWISAGVS